jgi:hypothetical protein
MAFHWWGGAADHFVIVVKPKDVLGRNQHVGYCDGDPASWVRDDQPLCAAIRHDLTDNATTGLVPHCRNSGCKSMTESATRPAITASPQRKRPIPVLILSLPIAAQPAISAMEWPQRAEAL